MNDMTNTALIQSVKDNQFATEAEVELVDRLESAVAEITALIDEIFRMNGASTDDDSRS